MIFNYGETKLKDGDYIVKIDNEPNVVAEYISGDWSQMGSDYDVWQHDHSRQNITIDVLAHIDVTTMEITKL